MNITLATLGNFTAQQVFDKVATHLLTQNAKSLGASLESDSCRYRGEGGTMCAAGCLIAEDEYLFGMEGCNWSSRYSQMLIENLSENYSRYMISMMWSSGLRVLW